MKFRANSLMTGFLVAICVWAGFSGVRAAAQDDVRSVADAAVQPLKREYSIPGMAIGLTAGGRTYVFNYGVASTQSGTLVTNETLFEVGSISKTITATLTSYAAANGNLSLSDRVDKFVPSLRGSKFGAVRLLNLGTHTPGGLPLQVPDNVTSDAQLVQYLQRWKPAYPPGTVRTYSNISIGVLGLIAARSMNQSYVGLVEKRLFPALGMKNSYMNVPGLKMKDYAQGYTANNRPIRMTNGVLWPEAYGVKTTAADLIRFIRDNMQMAGLDEKLQRSIMDTHTGYFKAGVMTQDLIWEQYPYPTPLSVLLQGNAPKMAFEPNRVTPITPAQAPRDDVWLNKTGSTNGFSAYVAFVPKEHMGIIILANKSYPIAQRIKLAYRILSQLAPKAAQ
jgi:beta-lactamase class C